LPVNCCGCAKRVHPAGTAPAVASPYAPTQQSASSSKSPLGPIANADSGLPSPAAVRTPASLSLDFSVRTRQHREAASSKVVSCSQEQDGERFATNLFCRRRSPASRAGRSRAGVTRLYAESPSGIDPVFRHFVPKVCPTRAHVRALWSTSDDDEGVRSMLPIKTLRALRRLDA
jgi:hypothetical protein